MTIEEFLEIEEIKTLRIMYSHYIDFLWPDREYKGLREEV